MSNPAQPIDLTHAPSSPKRMAVLNDYDIKLVKASDTLYGTHIKTIDTMRPKVKRRRGVNVVRVENQ